MNETTVGLPVIDALTLDADRRRLLRPGELVRTRSGAMHRLPRHFYVVESSSLAVSTPLTAHFGLWEFLEVDLHEAEVLRAYPRYVPCAVTLLAAALELLRLDLGVPIRIAANGGYRSPVHGAPSAHSWATAANIYRVGSEYVDTEESITRLGATARRLLAGAWTRPFGHGPGEADDHLHVDIGFATVVPREFSETDRS